MTPREFEVAVAQQLEHDGYETHLTSYGHDGGVDIIAKRRDECLAVQVKMYGGARAVNRRMIFELHGAAAYFDCNGAVMATDGDLLPDAAEAAAKLGVRVIRAGISAPAPGPGSSGVGAGRSDGFDEIWQRYVMPLAGRTLVRRDGSSNRIEQVDWAGVTRTSSNGRRGRIPIEPFRWAIGQILAGVAVSRGDINDHYEGRASSGIQLILEQVPLVECSGRPAVIGLRQGRRAPNA